MKKLKVVSIWIAVSLILQFTVLFYLDKFYFAEEKSVKYEVSNNDPKPTEEKLEIKVDDGAKFVQTSYDGKYVSYYLDSEKAISIKNMENNQVNKVELEKGTSDFKYKWVEDRNRIVIAEKQPDKTESVVKFYYYDVKNNEKLETRDFIKNKDVAIKIAKNDTKIEDIYFNTLNTIFYVKISIAGGTQTNIYRVDASSPIEKLSLKSTKIGEASIIKQEDKIVYEDLQGGKIYATNTKTPITINGVSRLTLISVDKSGVIYLGEVDGNKIKKLFYGNLKDKTDTWQSKEFKTSVSKEDIIILQDGKIYINNNLKGTITEILSEKETAYRGQFIQLFEGGVISNSDGIILKTTFSK
jgi:hypothetical protein